MQHRAGDDCGWGCLEVDSLDGVARFVAGADEVAKVFAGNFSVVPGLRCLFFLELQLFNVSLETDADVVGGTLQSAADLVADTKGVLVGVVDCC